MKHTIPTAMLQKLTSLETSSNKQNMLELDVSNYETLSEDSEAHITTRDIQD